VYHTYGFPHHHLRYRSMLNINFAVHGTTNMLLCPSVCV
jgi:hypothetical protein